MKLSKNPRDDFANSFSFPSKSRFEGAKFNLYSSTSIFLNEPTCQNKNIYMDFGNHTGNQQWMMNCSCLFIFLLVLSDRVRNLKGKSVISWAVRARIFCWTFKDQIREFEKAALIFFRNRPNLKRLLLFFSEKFEDFASFLTSFWRVFALIAL